MERQEYDGARRLRAMQDLAQRVSPVTAFRHVGDLTWNWALTLDPTVTALWYDSGQLVGWAWLEQPDGAMVQVDPHADPGLVVEVFDWLEARLDRPLRIEVAGTETALIAELEHRGYRVQSGPFMLSLRRDLDKLPAPELPQGYAIRPLTGPAEYPARLALHAAAFGSTRLTADRYAEMTAVWPYERDLVLVVTAPDGSLAAYCQGWYDYGSGIGEFEPVGTHPGHRRLGLASAVCNAVMHGFAERGGRRAVVYCRGDEAYPVPRLVYQSLGFVEVTRTAWYAR